MMEIKTKYGSHVLMAVGISYVGYAASMVSSIMLARLLGVEGKGEFALFQESALAIIIVANLGIGNGQVYRASKDPEKLKHFMSNGYLFSLALGLGCGVIYVLLGNLWSFTIVNLLGWKAVSMLIIMAPLMLAVIFQRQYFLATHAYKMAKANFSLAMCFPLVAYYVIYLLNRVNVFNMIVGLCVAQILTMFICHYVISGSAISERKVSLEFASDSLAFGLPFYLGELFQYMSYRIDFFFVAWNPFNSCFILVQSLLHLTKSMTK